jgi:type VI secretion system protein ImpC
MSAGEEEKTQAEATTTEAGSLLEQAIKSTKQTKRDAAEEMLRSLTEQALQGTVTYDKNVSRTINMAIAAIDRKVSEQLAKVMHHPSFQKLEGSWLGLKHLVANSLTGPNLKIKVLDVRKRELLKDLEDNIEASSMWNKLYSAEFDQAGGQPYGALVGDYEFENHPEDVFLLNQMSHVAAAGFCPFMSSASPKLLELENWGQLSDVDRKGNLLDTFDGKQYTQWKSFRDAEDSRFVVLTMPRTLARLPYGQNTKKIDEFNYEEVALGADGKSISVPHDQYCWMSTAYVLAGRLTDAFSKTGFCTAIRGKASGGRVEGLPAHIFRTEEGDMDLKCPTEIAIGDRLENELGKCGFLPLVHYKDTDYAVFMGGQTVQKPKVYDRPAATENAQISARLPYLMATGRFAHFLKAIGRDWVGSFKETTDLQKELHNWIHNYVTADSNPSEEQKASYPLAEAKIEVKPIPGQSGAYNAIAWLRPWLQMEELNASLRMVARIPGAK